MERIKDAFGIVVAFVVPGLMFMYAHSYFDTRVNVATLAKLSSIASVTVLIAAIGVGMIVYAFWAVVFRVLSFIVRFKTLTFEDEAEMDDDFRAKHSDRAFEENFRLYQFYGGAFVCLAYLAVGEYTQSGVTVPLAATILGATVCLPASFFCYHEYATRIRSLVAKSGTNVEVLSNGENSAEQFQQIESTSERQSERVPKGNTKPSGKISEKLE